MNWLDRTISFFSPSAACKRMAWRESLRSYDAGSNDRLNSGWMPVSGTAEQINQPSRDIIRARARDLERNSDIAEAIIGQKERNIVGTGITLQAKVKKPDGTDDDVVNKAIESLWKKWCKAKNCDITRQQSFWEMQSMAERRLDVDGGIIFIKTYTNNGILPFQLEIREVDDLDTSLSRLPGASGNRIINGIELDDNNTPTAYYLKKYSPDGYWDGKSTRIDAKRIIFLWEKQRPSQIREISPLARTLPRVRDVNSFMEALSVKERILACLGVFIKKQVPFGMGRNGKTDPQTGEKRQTISPGMIHYLQPGDDVATVSPNGQSSNAKEFINIQQRLAGSGQGLSYEATSRDMSQVNYSSARQGLLEDQKTYSRRQKFLIEHLLEVVYEEFLEAAELSGKLKLPGYRKDKERYQEAEWIAPGWAWIDPLKEVKANETALNTNQETLARICAERGLDWREVIKQRAAEKDLAEKLGLTTIITGGGISEQSQTSTQDGGAGKQDNSQS